MSDSTGFILPRQLDADHPWPGLAPFTSDNHRFFFGRDHEITEVFLRIHDHPLTVIYGQSGVGKTSIIGAGLMPKLTVEGWNPVLVRLRFEKGASPPADQVREALSLPARSPETAESPESLWELLHRKGDSGRSRIPDRTVLIFDQFEEVFTLGNSDKGREEVMALLNQIADVVENRPPAQLKERFRENRKLARDYDSSESTFRFVLTLREEYLANLESWGTTLPSLMRNRLGLETLTGLQASSAVVSPGNLGDRELVSESVGAEIVRWITPNSEDKPLQEIRSVPPPLLSLFCNELNAHRIEDGSPAITGELVRSQGRDILQSFFRKSFESLPSAAQVFVEERLITVNGHRAAVGRDDADAALLKAGVENTAEVLDFLIRDRRFLTAEAHGDQRRLEIAHDVLIPLVVRSRDERRQRIEAEKRAEAEKTRLQKAREEAEAKTKTLRRRAWMAGLIGIVAVCIPLAVIAWYQKARADRAHEEKMEILNAYGRSIDAGMEDADHRKVRFSVQSLLERDPDDQKLLAILNETNIALEDWGSLQEGLKKGPPLEESAGSQRIRQWAILAEAEGDRSNAIQAWSRFLQFEGLDPLKKKEGLLALAQLHQEKGNWQNAAEALGTALGIADVDTLLDLARLKIYRRLWDDGLDLFDLARKISPEAVQEQEPFFEKIRNKRSELEPVSLGSLNHLQRGILFSELELPELAAQEYAAEMGKSGLLPELEAAIHLLNNTYSGSHAAWTLTGDLWAAKQEFDEAVRCYSESIKRLPTKEAYLRKADVLDALDREDEAEAARKKATDPL